MPNTRRIGGGLIRPWPGPGNRKSVFQRYSSDILPTNLSPYAPALRSLGETASWHATTTPNTISISWQAGDTVIVIAATSDQSRTVNVPTGTTLSFSSIGSVTTGSSPWIGAWIATPASSGSGTLSFATSGATNQPWGAGAFVWYNTSGLGTVAAPAAAAAQTISVTTTSDASAMMYLDTDWGFMNGIIPSDAGWTPFGANEFEKSLSSGFYSAVGAYWIDLGPATTRQFGVSVPVSGVVHSRIAIELKAAVFGFEGWGNPL
jgi:hypothetical protein